MVEILTKTLSGCQVPTSVSAGAGPLRTRAVAAVVSTLSSIKSEWERRRKTFTMPNAQAVGEGLGKVIWRGEMDVLYCTVLHFLSFLCSNAFNWSSTDAVEVLADTHIVLQ